EVEMVIYREGTTITKTVTLGSNPRDDSGYLGILMYDISGVYSILSSYNPIRWVISIFMPFQVGGALFFNGFHGDVTQFYRLTGPAASLGGYFWAIPNILFWTAWINFNLAFFNCVPAVPLDGGHILREVVSRTMKPFFSGERLEEIAGVVTMAVAVMMFGSLILMVVAPRLLS
ncbi:MAG: site-2 protease family protein, partial [Halobacteria archaeon]|nr:site-2 protease family protein [Halobacteria archaeon]